MEVDSNSLVSWDLNGKESSSGTSHQEGFHMSEGDVVSILSSCMEDMLEESNGIGTSSNSEPLSSYLPSLNESYCETTTDQTPTPKQSSEPTPSLTLSENHQYLNSSPPSHAQSHEPELSACNADLAECNPKSVNYSQHAQYGDIFVFPKIDQSTQNQNSRKRRSRNPYARVLTASPLVKAKRAAMKDKQDLEREKSQRKKKKTQQTEKCQKQTEKKKNTKKRRKQKETK